MSPRLTINAGNLSESVHVHAPPDSPVSCWGSHRSDGNAGSWSGMINGSQHILVDYRTLALI